MKKLFFAVIAAAALWNGSAADGPAERPVTVTSLCLLEGDSFRNREYVFQALNRIRPAAENPHLVVTPFMPFLEFHEECAAEDLADFRRWAQEHSAILVVGLKEIAGSKIYHTSVIIEPSGKIAGKYRKTHRTDQDGADFDLGSDLPVFDGSRPFSRYGNVCRRRNLFDPSPV